MKVTRCLPPVLCLFLTLAAYGQKEDWLPVTQQDLQYKEVPGNKGASAVRLYYAQYINDNTASCFFYERIKILNEKALNPDARGKTYADVEIPILTIGYFVEDITDLKARTIKPDGSIVEFTGKPFERIVFKGWGNKFAVKAFSMPEAGVGSIIEYKYRTTLSLPAFTFIKIPVRNEWDIQSELFTVKESLYYQPNVGDTYQSPSRPHIEYGGERISSVTMNMKEKPREKGSDSELELTNVPPFESEDFMPPENNFKPSVIFFTGRKGKVDVDKEWQEIGKDFYDSYEKYMSANRGVKEAALQAIGGETEPEKRLRKVYERVQQVRNLTFERSRTREERKAENIQKNFNVGDVLAHGYGSDEEITLLFVAMARAAGFDTAPVKVSDRRRRFFVREWTSWLQIHNLIAVVNLNGSDIYLEPGTRLCPFGLVRWNHTAIEGLKLDRKGGAFVKAPTSGYDKSVTTRIASMSLGQDGTAKGVVTLEFKGAEALEHRLDAIDRDEAGRRKDLEDELKQWLPAGAIVKMNAAQGWDNADSPLAAGFDVELPNYATLAGKRLLIPAFLFQTKQNQAFAHAQRKYPVYFPYPFTDNDSVTIKVPAGFTLESTPPQEDAKLPYARYQSVSRFSGLELLTQRQLAFNGIYFPVEKYSELKSFFGRVQADDEQQAVLRAGGTTSAQKSN